MKTYCEITNEKKKEKKLTWNEICDKKGIYKPSKFPKTRIIIGELGNYFFLSSDNVLLSLHIPSWEKDTFVEVSEKIIITFDNT